MPSLRIRSFIHPPATCHFATPVLRQLRPENAHDHDFVEIFWIEAGQGGHWINESRRPLSAGSLVFVRAADRHTFTAASANDSLRMVNVAFAHQTWQALRDRYKLMDLFDPTRADPLELMLSETQLAAAQSAAAQLRIGRLDRLETDRFLLNFTHLIEADAETIAPGGSAPPWLGKLLRILSNPTHPGAPTTTRELAKLVGCSAEHLARTARRFLGRSPTELLNDAKLTRAAIRLAGTNDQILDISMDCGFGNLSHFYKLFRDRYRITPRHYRLSQQRIVWPQTNKG